MLFRRYQKHEHKNFTNTHMEATAEYIATKQKQNRIPWEKLTVKKKYNNVKTASLIQ